MPAIDPLTERRAGIMAALADLADQDGRLPDDWAEQLPRVLNRQWYDISQDLPHGAVAGNPGGPWRVTEVGRAYALLAKATGPWKRP